MSTVKVMKEVVHPGHPKDNWHLALQRAAITYSDGRAVKAYRFVCREGLGKPEPVVRRRLRRSIRWKSTPRSRRSANDRVALRHRCVLVKSPER
jgi:hypothetical protein